MARKSATGAPAITARQQSQRGAEAQAHALRWWISAEERDSKQRAALVCGGARSHAEARLTKRAHDRAQQQGHALRRWVAAGVLKVTMLVLGALGLLLAWAPTAVRAAAPISIAAAPVTRSGSNPAVYIGPKDPNPSVRAP